MTITAALTHFFRLLPKHRRECLRDHLRAGHPVACGKSANAYVSRSGAG